MPDDIRDILVEIIDSYGIKILEDPDRLAQFLEDRSSLRPEDTFHLTFALRFLLKCGWRPSRREYMKEGADYRASLESQLGFTKEQAAEVMKLINWLMEMEYGGSEDEEETGVVVAVPGNLKKIAGGVANRPRTMRIRKKSLYNGIILIVSLAVLAALFFQIGNQRTPAGDELRIAFFAPMSGPDARLSHVQLKAAQLAVERVNSRGLARGEYKLKVIGFDLPADPAAAERAVENVMKDKSMLVMVLGRASAAKTLAPLADELEAPLVVASPNPLEAPLLDESSLPYLYSFSLVNDAASRGKILSYFATQALHKKKIAFYYDPSDAVSSAVYKSARKWAVGFGAEVVAELPYGRGGGHYAAMRAFAESGADLLMLPGAGAAAGEILPQRAAAGFGADALGDGYTDRLPQQAGRALAGSWWINEVSALDPQISSVLREYRSLYNEECQPGDVTAAILSYDAVMWIASAFRSTPGFRGEAIRHTLLATRDLVLAHTTLTIDPRTHMPLNKSSAIIYCEEDKGIFQRRFTMRRN